MPRPFRFDRTWVFDRSPSALWDALADPAEYPRWWPWLQRFEVDPPGARLDAGTTARAAIRPPLPYTLDFSVTVVEADAPARIDAIVRGDLHGAATLDLSPHPDGSAVRLQWEVDLRAPVLRAAALLARPLMEWGHDWVVRTGVSQFEARALRSP